MPTFRETCLDILHRCGDALRARNEKERREREKKERHRERCRKYRQRKKEEDREAFLQKRREEAQACRDRAKAEEAEAVQKETKESRKHEAQFHAEMQKIARSPIAVPEAVRPRQREPWEIAADIDRLFREQTQPAEPHTFTEAEERERREELERSMHKDAQPSTDGKKKPRTPEEEEKLEASRRYNRRHRAYKKYIKELDDIDAQTKLTSEERRKFKDMALRRYQAKMGCDVGEVPEAPKPAKVNEQYAGLSPAEARRKQDETLRRLQDAQQRREESEREERERRQMETMQQRLADAYRASITPQAVIDRRPVCYDPHCMRCSRRLNSQGQHVCSLSECVLLAMKEREARHKADLERAARPIEGAECYDPTAVGAFNREDYNHYAHELRHAYYARPFSLEAMDAENYRLDAFNEALYPNARN